MFFPPATFSCLHLLYTMQGQDKRSECEDHHRQVGERRADVDRAGIVVEHWRRVQALNHFGLISHAFSVICIAHLVK
jgi:hypothetical protein